MKIKYVLATLLCAFPMGVQAQTWVQNWDDSGFNTATTSDGGALLTVVNNPGFVADDLFVHGSSTFAGTGFSTETGSFTHLATSNGNTSITFTLQAGYVFDTFSMVGIDGTANAPTIALGSGLSWSLQETQSPLATITGQTLNYDGPFIADVNGVNGVNSFTMTWTTGGGSEDDPVGYAYSVTLAPEPSSSMLLALSSLALITRRRRS